MHDFQKKKSFIIKNIPRHVGINCNTLNSSEIVKTNRLQLMYV